MANGSSLSPQDCDKEYEYVSRCNKDSPFQPLLDVEYRVSLYRT